jgi:hypothetical protein
MQSVGVGSHRQLVDGIVTNGPQRERRDRVGNLIRSRKRPLEVVTQAV